MAKLVRIMWIPVILCALYTCLVLLHRHPFGWGSKFAFSERDPMAAYGSNVKILQFYSTAREIAPGEKTIVCYGVVNATTLRLDPPVEKVWPAVSRCFNVTPANSTRYTLTAEDSRHTTVSESIEISVKP